MVEYAILLVGILLVVAGAARLLGVKVRSSVEHAGNVATSSSSGADPNAGTSDMDEPTARPAEDTSFGFRQGFALALMVLGVGSVAYFFIKGKKAAGDAKAAK